MTPPPPRHQTWLGEETWQMTGNTDIDIVEAREYILNTTNSEYASHTMYSIIQKLWRRTSTTAPDVVRRGNLADDSQYGYRFNRNDLIHNGYYS